MEHDENMVSIMDFVEEYNKCKSQEERQSKIESVVKHNAITRYASKLSVVNMVLSMSHLDENGVFKKNSALEHQKYIFALISFYTILRKPPETTDDDMFDYLNYYDVINPLIQCIKNNNARDIGDFDEVLKASREDLFSEHTQNNLTLNGIEKAIENGFVNAFYRLSQLNSDDIQDFITNATNNE
jgi:hypothetical protein